MSGELEGGAELESLILYCDAGTLEHIGEVIAEALKTGSTTGSWVPSPRQQAAKAQSV